MVPPPDAFATASISRRKTLPRARNGQPRTWLTQARARGKEAGQMVHENDYVVRQAPRERGEAEREGSLGDKRVEEREMCKARNARIKRCGF